MGQSALVSPSAFLSDNILNAIYKNRETVNRPVAVPDSASVTRSPTGSIRTILSVDSGSSVSSNGSRSTVFVPEKKLARHLGLHVDRIALTPVVFRGLASLAHGRRHRHPESRIRLPGRRTSHHPTARHCVGQARWRTSTKSSRPRPTALVAGLVPRHYSAARRVLAG